MTNLSLCSLRMAILALRSLIRLRLPGAPMIQRAQAHQTNDRAWVHGELRQGNPRGRMQQQRDRRMHHFTSVSLPNRNIRPMIVVIAMISGPVNNTRNSLWS